MKPTILVTHKGRGRGAMPYAFDFTPEGINGVFRARGVSLDMCIQHIENNRSFFELFDSFNWEETGGRDFFSGKSHPLLGNGYGISRAVSWDTRGAYCSASYKDMETLSESGKYGKQIARQGIKLHSNHKSNRLRFDQCYFFPFLETGGEAK